MFIRYSALRSLECYREEGKSLTMQEREGRVDELHLDAIQGLGCRRDVEQVQDHGLVSAQHGSACHTWCQGISDLACRTARQASLATPYNVMAFLAVTRCAGHGDEILTSSCNVHNNVIFLIAATNLSTPQRVHVIDDTQLRL